MSIEGHCHCGEVLVSIPDDAAGVVGCHCGDCQRLHGTNFAMLAVDRPTLRVKGEEHVRGSVRPPPRASPDQERDAREQA